MIYKLGLGHGFILATEIHAIDCPNKYGGIGDMLVSGEFWTGDTWLYLSRAKVDFGAIKSVVIRSNVDESSEPWVTIWNHPTEFNYEAWFKLARLLKNST